MHPAPLPPSVGVVYARDRAPGVKSLADLTDPERATHVLCDEILPLADALETAWEQDVHFCTYWLEDEDGDRAYARANKRSIFPAELLRAGGKIQCWGLAFDYDLPKLGTVKQVWRQGGLDEFLQGLVDADLPPPFAFYTTRHGARFVYLLTEPVDHLTAEGLARAIFVRYKSAGIELDESCCDWTRLFRLPKVRREDTGARSEDEDSFLLVIGEDRLDPSTIPIAASSAVEVFADARPYDGEIPDADDVRDLLVTKAKNGRVGDTAWAKTAKKYLQGREPSYSVCFQDKPIPAERYNGRNNALTKMIGQIVGMTIRTDEASPEGVYALIHSAVEQLCLDCPEGTNWHSVAWDLVCRMWANEQAQVDAELQEREAQQTEAAELRVNLLEQARAARPQDVPDDPVAAEEWFRQRLIASDGQRHYVMRRDGSYNVNAVGDSMLVPMIKDLGMTDVIQTHEIRGKSWVERGSRTILNEHASPVTSVHCSARDRTAYISGQPGNRVLHVPVHRPNPRLKPAYSSAVDSWLRVFAGDKYDLLHDWLSWAMESAMAICALNLYGAKGSGKGMLVQGLVECFEGEQINDGRAMDRFNIGLLSSPLISCDEGVPRIKGLGSATDEVFRSLVTGGSIAIEGKMRDIITASIYPRIIFTSNDRDIMRDIVGAKDLSEDAVQAIEQRLLTIEVQREAVTFLTAHGNMAFTRGWVHGQHESRYTLANHIAWLYDHRKPSKTSTGRLLVEGELGTQLVRSMRLRSDAAQAVLRALIGMVEACGRPSRGLYVVEGRVYVTAAGVVEYIGRGLNEVRETVSLPQASRVLRQFAVDAVAKKITPPGGVRGRWVEVDLAMLLEEASRYGMPAAALEALLRQQPQGDRRAALALLGGDE